MQFIGNDDEIPMWNRDRLWKPHLFGNDDEIPMWNRDRLWKSHLFGGNGEIPAWNRDKAGKAIYLIKMMKFQCGIETNVEMQ